MLAKVALGICALITAAATGYGYYRGGFSGGGFERGSPHGWKPGGVHGVPGPLMGAAGLPMLVAYGVYRFARPSS